MCKYDDDVIRKSAATYMVTRHTSARTCERLVGGRLGVLEPVRLVADEEVAAALAALGEVVDVPAERLCVCGGVVGRRVDC